VTRRREIEVTVDAQGNFELQAHGYGKDCEKATAALERLLGTKTGDRRTTEFYARQVATEKAKARR
jgi:hypothetical protein